MCVVWSDFKNNAKKKNGRMCRSARGTGGGPASKIKLSAMEERVINLIGTRAATGIVEIPEVGLENEGTEQPPLSDTYDCHIIINQQHDQETHCSKIKIYT
ncbi:unnamed protein product [Euphydryas editha]|uniref:Uncharacterized protein n=1 Tax=Euphydryas editha TaxID=104508 RepID=A0AAU9UCW9_EUPED|nr:unnamed protein product [Euphydryas editha]